MERIARSSNWLYKKDQGIVLIKNTVIVTSVQFINIVSGIVLDAIILAFLGLGIQTDAYFVALSIPFMFISTAQLLTSKVVQPRFIHIKESEGEVEAFRYVNSVIFFGLLVFIGYFLVGTVFNDLIIKVLIPGAKPQTALIAGKLYLWLSILPCLYLFISVVRTVLYAYNIFGITTGFKMVENMCKLVAVIGFGRVIGIYSLVYGYLLGGVLQVMLGFLMCKKINYSLGAGFNIKNENLRLTIKNSIYPLFGIGSTQSLALFQNFLLSFLFPGAITSLRIATRLIDALSGLASGGVVTVLLPMVTKSYAQDEHAGVKYDITRGVKILAYITFPLMFFLAVLNKPIVSVLYQRMEFSEKDTVLVATLILLMVPYIFFSRLIGVLETTFFGQGDTKTPFYSMVFLVLSYVIVTLVIFESHGVRALALSRSISYMAAVVLLLYLTKRRIGELPARELYNYFARIIVLCITSSVAAYASYNGFWLIKFVSFGVLTRLAFATFVSGIVFVVMSFALNIISIKYVMQRIRTL